MELDKEIIKLQKEKQKETYHDITEGVYIKEVFTKFSRRSFFEEKMSIMTPEDFIEMPDEIAQIKYPGQQRPQIILTTLDCTVNFSMSYFDQDISPDQVEQALTGYQRLIRQMNPANIFFATTIEVPEKNCLGWFSYKGYALDEHLYNLLFVTRIEKKLLLGSFNCIFSEMKEWEDYVIQMLKSIIDHTIKEN